MRLEKRGRQDQSGRHRSRKTEEYNQPEILMNELIVTAGMLGYWKVRLPVSIRNWRTNEE